MEQISLILKEKNLIASPVYDLEPSNWQVTHVDALSSRRQFRFPLALELVLILMVLVLLFSSPLTPPQLPDQGFAHNRHLIHVYGIELTIKRDNGLEGA